MSGFPSGGGLPQRLLGGALVLLLAAWALSEAVALMTTVWVPLAIIAAIVGLIVAATAWRRRRGGGW